MKFCIYLLGALCGCLCNSYVALADTDVDLEFDLVTPLGKTFNPVSPVYVCRLKSGVDAEVFEYSDADCLVKRISSRMSGNQDDVLALSISGCHHELDVWRVFNLLKFKGVRAYSAKISIKAVSGYNFLTGSIESDLVKLAFAESRVRCMATSCPKVNRDVGSPHSSAGCLGLSILPNCTTSCVACISHANSCGVKVVKGGEDVYFPDVDVMLMCDPIIKDNVRALCYFIGPQGSPFEGAGRALPCSLRNIANIKFEVVDPNVRFRREFGFDPEELDGDGLAKRILNDPRKDEMLRVLDEKKADNELGSWFEQGRYIATQPTAFGLAKGDEYALFVSHDRKMRVVTLNGMPQCVIVSFPGASRDARGAEGQS